MKTVTYSLGMSLDGYVVDTAGGFDWTTPDDEEFQFVTEEIRRVDAHLLGRRLYETMLFWETADQHPDIDDATRTWAELWKAIPKVVFSRTLTSVEGTNTRLATGTLADEIARLRAEPGDGEIAIGGASLAASAAADGLIDEYLPRVYPVLVGGGIPFFPPDQRRVDLELVETHRFTSGALSLRYRVRPTADRA